MWRACSAELIWAFSLPKAQYDIFQLGPSQLLFKSWQASKAHHTTGLQPGLFRSLSARAVSTSRSQPIWLLCAVRDVNQEIRSVHIVRPSTSGSPIAVSNPPDLNLRTSRQANELSQSSRQGTRPLDPSLLYRFGWK